MDCVVYKGKKKQDTYLFVKNAEDFSTVPEKLLSTLGELEFVMLLTLSPERKLARTDTKIIQAALIAEGYFLQPPPADTLQMIKPAGF